MNNNILLKQKQSRILVVLRDTSQVWYISSLAKTSNTTYVHACNFLAACEALGIVTSEKHGKLKLITLTDKGLRIADMLVSMNNMLAQEVKQPSNSTSA